MTPARAILDQAIGHHRQNRLAEAERLYRAVLAQEPLNHVALHNLGLIAGATGHLKPALEHVTQAVRLDPSNPSYLASQIGLLDALGRRDEADTTALKLIALRPADPAIRADYARLLSKYLRYDESARQWDIVCDASPADFGARFHCAEAYEAAGILDRAEARYRDALAVKPDFGEAMVNLAGIMLRTDRTVEGCETLERATKLLPENGSVLATLGSALTNVGRFAEGLATIKRAAALAPRDIDVLRNLGYAHLVRGDVEASLDVQRQISQIVPDHPHVYATLLLTSLYVEASPEAELKLHQEYNRRALVAVKPTPAAPRAKAPGERVRIGYVSPDFRNHPVGHFIEPVLAHHDRARFEVHCFSNSSTCDDYTKRIMSSVDAFHTIQQFSFEEFDRTVREKQIDILIDLAGHTGGSCLLVFAAKPAPLQITYLGYPHTTGLATIDYRITDPIADPPGVSDPYHAEKLLRLPMSFGLFKPPVGAPPVAPAPCLRSGFLTFGSVSRIEKWTPLTLANWSSAMSAAPASRLRLIGLGFEDSEFKEHVLKRLAAAGIDPARVELVNRRPFLEYLAEVSQIDLMLDTYPFNGHTTTLQALYMGVPTLTLTGASHRSRMGMSVMTALNLPEFIADSPQTFRDRAATIAKAPDRLAALRETLRERLMSSGLTDAPRFVAQYEALLLQAWDQTLQGSRTGK